MIIRRKSHPHDFVIIDQKPLRNRELSWRAKGLLSYFMTLPGDWVVVMSDLVNRSRDGRRSTQKAFLELRDAGHAVLVSVRDSHGRMAGKEWHIHEVARVGKF